MKIYIIVDAVIDEHHCVNNYNVINCLVYIHKIL